MAEYDSEERLVVMTGTSSYAQLCILASDWTRTSWRRELSLSLALDWWLGGSIPEVAVSGLVFKMSLNCREKSTDEALRNV